MRKFIIMGLLLIGFVSCNANPTETPDIQVSPLDSPLSINESPVPPKDAGPTVVQSTPLPDRTAITGRILSLQSTSSAPISGVVVRLARVFWNEDKSDGAFAVEAAQSPSTITDANGAFFLGDLEPADYVIVVGDLEGDNVIISEGGEKARVFSTHPGEILKVGDLRVDLSP